MVLYLADLRPLTSDLRNFLFEKRTKTIGINMNRKMADKLEKRAGSMHISTSNYCKIILQQWIDSGKKLTLSE